MAISNAGQASLTFTNLPIGVQVTKITDTSADWASVANSTYFYDKGDGLVHYKNSSGIVLELFSAGGLTYFTEAENTATPNTTVYVDSLTAAASTTNADFGIRPKGTGAFILAVPDNNLGGNKRGQYTVDLQLYRAAPDRIASGNYAFAAGSDSIASGNYSIAIGQFCNATGANSINIGSGFGSGSQAIAIGYSSNAGLYQSVAFGQGITASGQEAMALGHATIASNSYSYAFGRETTCSGFCATAIGNNVVASGSYSLALGNRSNNFSIHGRQVYASGQMAVSGDAQTSKFVLRRRTTDATPTTITTDSTGGTTTNQIILSNQSAYRFKGTIIGKLSGTTGTCAWDIDGLIVRGAIAASTTLLVGNVNVVYDPGIADSPPTLTADTINGGLRVQVTGTAANIQWTAVIDTTEVIYA